MLFFGEQKNLSKLQATFRKILKVKWVLVIFLKAFWCMMVFHRNYQHMTSNLNQKIEKNIKFQIATYMLAFFIEFCFLLLSCIWAWNYRMSWRKLFEWFFESNFDSSNFFMIAWKSHKLLMNVRTNDTLLDAKRKSFFCFSFFSLQLSVAFSLRNGEKACIRCWKFLLISKIKHLHLAFCSFDRDFWCQEKGFWDTL